MCEGLSKISGPIPPHPMFDRNASILDSSRSDSNSMCEGPSKISGPIQSDYTQAKLLNHFSQLSVGDPRVRGKGREFYIADRNGSGVAALLQLQGQAINPSTYKIKEKPRNYINSNCTKIKTIIRKVKQREEAKKEPVKVLWKSEQYKNVQSKLKEILEKQTPDAPRAPREFLRAHSRTGSSLSSRPQSARLAPRENTEFDMAADKIKSKDDLDFIKLNKKLSKELPLKRAPSVEQLKQVQEKKTRDLETYELNVKGKVPDYLQKRRHEWMEEKIKKINSIPDPEQPPGHRKLSDDERVQTLEKLKQTQQSLLNQMNTLPIRSDTFRIQSYKNDFDKRLCEIEEAIKLFSKPKVFVKIDE